MFPSPCAQLIAVGRTELNSLDHQLSSDFKLGWRNVPVIDHRARPREGVITYLSIKDNLSFVKKKQKDLI